MKDTVEAPHRACRLELDLDADTKGDLIAALDDISRRIAIGDIGPKGVSAGWSYSFTYELDIGDSPTGDEYRAQVHAYVNELRNRDTERGSE